MASAPQAEGLPILYKDLVPLSAQIHGTWTFKPFDTLDLIKDVHAMPLTVDEFVIAQRHFPIVFSSGTDPVPLALMGLNEGVNVFVGEDGQTVQPVYIPAYVRRYPFMLARISPDAQEMTLCFDPESGLIEEGGDGNALFEGEEPSQTTKDILGYCEQFEMAAQRTAGFCKELAELKLLEEAEVTIQHGSTPNPFIYRGFQMVSEEKLRDLRGDQLRKMSQSGMLPLIHAHIFSLSLMNEIFSRQFDLGKAPTQNEQG